MKNKISKFIFAILIISISLPLSAQEKMVIISVDSLANNIENYIGKRATIEGKIVHICPIGGLKMKLKSESGIIVKIESGAAYKKFDTSYYNKTCRITGTVKEVKTDTAFITKVEKNRTILCHIDNTYCKDKKWIEARVKEGSADSISIKTTNKLKAKMKETKKSYVSTPCITAEKIEEIN